MALRWLKWQLAHLSGNDELLKKKKLRARRDKVTRNAAERQLERQWYYTFVDRSVRAKLRILLSRTEMTAVGLVFDRMAKQREGELLGAVDFVIMVLTAGGVRESECTVEEVDALLHVFEHAKVFYRHEFVIPGKEHPYIAERKQRTLRFRAKQAVRRAVLDRLRWRGGGDDENALSDIDEDDETRVLREEREVQARTICLHELLLSISFWRHQVLSEAAYADEPDDDVNYFFRLFDSGLRKRWAPGEFAAAMRALLEGVYISDYEDRVSIPEDCDPNTQSREEMEAAKYLTIDEQDAQEEKVAAERKRRFLLNRYLNEVFDDIDKAQMEAIDLEDFEEWLQENGTASAEFQDKTTGASTLMEAFSSVGAADGTLDREQFMALAENSRLLSHRLNDELELKLFKLSTKIADEELNMGKLRCVTLPQFRKYLKSAPDKRIAYMVARVARTVRLVADGVDPRGRDMLLKVIGFQVTKPKFATLRANAPLGPRERKALKSKSLTVLRKAFIRRSPLEQLKIKPLDAEPVAKRLLPVAQQSSHNVLAVDNQKTSAEAEAAEGDGEPS